MVAPVVTAWDNGHRTREVAPAVEVREQVGYTDALVSALLRQVRGNNGTPITAQVTGALESCAGLVGHAFAAAEVHGPEWATSALSPEIMQMIGRALIRRGDNVYYLDTTDGLTIIPGQTHSVDGHYMPATWVYDVSLPGPATTHSVITGAENVLHLRYATDPQTPWRGHSPLGVATETGRLSAEVISALADESSGPRGSFLSVPSAEAADKIPGDIKAARGTMLILETLVAGWEGATAIPADWTAKRFGPAPTQYLVELLSQARAEVYAACGINSAMFDASGVAALREAYRLFLFTVVAPLGKLVAGELAAKIDPGITLDWTELRAADVQGRARAMNSMVKGGMALAEAVALSGLMVDSE